MIKINKMFLVLICIINALFMISINKVYSTDDGTRYITGKIIYSDDKSPVSEGIVKLIAYQDNTNTGRIIETVNVMIDGTFKIKSSSLNTTDNIKIMAYPNDVDFLPDGPYEPATYDLNKTIINIDNEYPIIIEVKRNIARKNKKNTGFDNKNILQQNYPNPFNPTTVIKFILPDNRNVLLDVYNMSGAKVATLIDNKNLKKGLNEVMFNAKAFPSGIYIYTLKAGDITENKKMILIK